MGIRRIVTVRYGENKLLETIIALPPSTTVAIAKKIASEEILKHICLKTGVSQDIVWGAIDQECIDFYPVAPDNTRIHNLCDDITVVVWPPKSSTPGSALTPLFPITADGYKTAQLDDELGAGGALIKEDDQLTLTENFEPGSSSSPPFDAASEDDLTENAFLSELKTMKASIEEIKKRDAEKNERLRTMERSTEKRERRLEELKRSTEEMERSIEEMEALLQTTMKAVLGDHDAMNKIRNHVLLNLGRNRLAVICGYRDWKAWEASYASPEDIFNCAVTRLETPGDDLPQQWLALGRRHTALRMLLLPNQVRDRGDLAASSTKQSIEESILSLTVDREREDVTAIFKAVYEEEPAH